MSCRLSSRAVAVGLCWRPCRVACRLGSGVVGLLLGAVSLSVFCGGRWAVVGCRVAVRLVLRLGAVVAGFAAGGSCRCLLVRLGPRSRLGGGCGVARGAAPFRFAFWVPLAPVRCVRWAGLCAVAFWCLRRLWRPWLRAARCSRFLGRGVGGVAFGVVSFVSSVCLVFPSGLGSGGVWGWCPASGCGGWCLLPVGLFGSGGWWTCEVCRL